MYQKISIPLMAESDGQRIKVGQAVATYICEDYIDITAKIDHKTFVGMINHHKLSSILIGHFSVDETGEEDIPPGNLPHNSFKSPFDQSNDSEFSG